MDLLTSVASTVKRHSMLAGEETVLVGLSGGPDSVCLLVALRRLYPGLKLRALYVDHGLRPRETGKEARLSRALCEDMGIPFSVASVDVKAHASSRGLNRQEAARGLRYQALHDEALRAKAERVALGHNLDDQVETFFMRILRGTGLRGLLAIPPVRGNIIRPLIETERREIEAFLRTEGIGSAVDSSNLKDDYLRNRVRSTLIPLLRELNPEVMKTLARTTDILREEERYLEVAVTKALMKLISRKSPRRIELFSVPLEGMDRVMLRRVLRRALEETEGLRGIGFTHIEDIIRLVKDGKAGDRVCLPREIRAIKRYSTLVITSEPPVKIGARSLGEGETAFIREAGVAIAARVTSEAVNGSGTRAVLDAERVSFPLTVRPRKEGDFFFPAGLGGRKKLQDFFVDEKVPRDERDSVPIVASGDDILWVAGMRVDERFKHTEGTKRFLILELKPLDA